MHSELDATAPGADCATVVLGLGNLLRRDEGLGIRALTRLQQQYSLPASVQVVDGGTLGLELLSYLEGARRVLVLDAALTDGSPGTIICLHGDEVPAFFGMRSSPHEIGLPDLLAVARLRGAAPTEITLIGMQPGVIELGWELSAVVADHLDALVETTIKELVRWGVQVTPKTPDQPALESVELEAHDA
jgi:hydrogenase maturation protease